ncbi:hypothetical protein BGAL_0132g00050 [Botrytis galanthina]|uniref:Uncharacterized protein n=1 Tax=Botrytis galanthina TaxID=278940 RepID=A0A4S8R437_9HELO|nr:hypothetical protein BGAL_0132g00050 [Botrytis galanthina]
MSHLVILGKFQTMVKPYSSKGVSQWALSVVVLTLVLSSVSAFGSIWLVLLMQQWCEASHPLEQSKLL